MEIRINALFCDFPALEPSVLALEAENCFKAILDDTGEKWPSLLRDKLASMTFEEKDTNALASIEDAEKLLDQLLLREVEIDAQLEHLLNPHNQPDIIALTSLQSTVNIEEQLLQLNDRIFPAAETASGLSERVKKLDIEQARVKESVKYVEDVQELKVYLIRNIIDVRIVCWVSTVQWTNKIGMKQLPTSIKHPSSTIQL